jgi:hypothetical protein
MIFVSINYLNVKFFSGLVTTSEFAVLSTDLFCGTLFSSGRALYVGLGSNLSCHFLSLLKLDRGLFQRC